MAILTVKSGEKMRVNINEVIARNEYAFLREDVRLGASTIFLTLGGSHSYGTSREDSDIDVRGCAFGGVSDLLGLTSFEQVTDNATDTTVYSLNKLVRLLLACTPNTIEMLGGRAEDYVFFGEAGRVLIDNRALFLSRVAAKSFGGYVNQQLRRLENALARDSYPHAEKERHILGSCQSAMMSLNERYSALPEGGIGLYIGKALGSELDGEILADIHLEGYPLRDYKSIWADLSNIVKDYGKLNQRNRKKDEPHLSKHMMHLIRLYMMGIDILERGEIVTYREREHELLMSLRNGEFLANGQTTPAFGELLHDYERRFEYACENTALPEKPDFDAVNEMTIELNRRHLAKSGREQV